MILISLKFGISVVTIEILGGMILTFLTGAEVAFRLFKEKFSQNPTLGAGSFALPAWKPFYICSSFTG